MTWINLLSKVLMTETRTVKQPFQKENCLSLIFIEAILTEFQSEIQLFLPNSSKRNDTDNETYTETTNLICFSNLKLIQK